MTSSSIPYCVLFSIFWLCLVLAPLVEGIAQSDVQRAVDNLDGLIRRVLNQTGVPSIAAAVVFNGSVLYTNAFGRLEIGSNKSATAESVYQLASLSKPISSTVIAGLVADGHLNWTSSANELDPLVELSDAWITREVTVEDFFMHRSGLFGTAGDDLEALGYNRTEILSRLKYLQPTGPFRASYQYSNYGITSGAVAAASAAGSTWEDLAASRLYNRCNMTSTSSINADFLKESNRASLHVRKGNGTNFSAPYIVAPARNPDPQSPAGGVTSNVVDLSQWLLLQLGNGTLNGEEIIDSIPLLYTHQPHIIRGIDPASGRLGFYGLGWNVDYDAPNSGRVFIGHAGAFSSGTRSYARLNIADGLGIVVLSNCWPTGVPEGIAFTFLDWVYYGNQTQDWVQTWDGLYDQLNEQIGATDPGFDVSPTSSTRPLPEADVYAGTYSNDYVGVVTVAEEADGLNRNLTMFIGEHSWPLTYWDRDIFVLRAVAENPEAPSAVTFVIGPGGTAEQVVIETLNGDGGGVLDRVG